MDGFSYEAEGVFIRQCVFSLCGRARDHLLRIKGEAGKLVISRHLRILNIFRMTGKMLPKER